MKRLGLFIGSSEFPNMPDLRNLETSINDVETLKSVFEDTAHEIESVMKPLSNPARSEALAAIDALFNFEADEDDIVLLLISGHGILNPSLKLFIPCHDSVQSQWFTMIAFDEIMQIVLQSRIKRVAIFLDCCFSGTAGDQFYDTRGAVPAKAESVDEYFSSFDELRRESTQPYDPRGPSASEPIARMSPDPLGYGSGLYLMTACAQLETAAGDRSTGLGLFSKALFDGMRAEASISHPGNSSVTITTVGSLFEYVSDALKETPQTPMLWGREQSSMDLVLSARTLAGLRQRGVPRVQRRNLLDHSCTTLLPHLGPAYVLDNAFRFADWNALFEELIARPLSLTRGMHAEKFLETLNNWGDVNLRSQRVFRPPYPRSDVEELLFPSNKFGLPFGTIRFTKIAAEIRAEHGLGLAWIVLLNITSVANDHGFWPMVEGIMKKDSNWSAYSHHYDEVIGNFPEYRKLKDLVVSLAGQAHRVLDLGAGTGNCTLSLLEADPHRTVCAVESNDEMLMRLDEKISRDDSFVERTEVIKCDVVSHLREEDDDSYDAVVMLNVLFAIDDPVECLKQAHRVLMPGGSLVLSTSHERTNIHQLFQRIQGWLIDSNRMADLGHAFNEARQRNFDMEGIINRYSLDYIRRIIEGAGFRVEVWKDSEYVNCVVVAEAKKVVDSAG